MPKADTGHSTNVPVLPAPSRRPRIGTGAALLAAGAAAALPSAAAASSAPTIPPPSGAVWELGQRFRAAAVEFDRLDEAAVAIRISSRAHAPA